MGSLCQLYVIPYLILVIFRRPSIVYKCHGFVVSQKAQTRGTDKKNEGKKESQQGGAPRPGPPQAPGTGTGYLPVSGDGGSEDVASNGQQ